MIAERLEIAKARLGTLVLEICRPFLLSLKKCSFDETDSDIVILKGFNRARFELFRALGIIIPSRYKYRLRLEWLVAKILYAKE